MKIQYPACHSHASNKDCYLLLVSSVSQSISDQTKENGNLNSGSIKNDITNYKSHKSSIVLTSSNDLSRISKTMTGTSRIFL